MTVSNILSLQAATVSRREQLGTDDSALDDKKRAQIAESRGRGPGRAGRGRGRGRGGTSGVVGDDGGDQGEEVQAPSAKKRPRSKAAMKRPAAKPKAQAAKPSADLAEEIDDMEKGRNGSKSTPVENKKTKESEKKKGKDGKEKAKETVEEVEKIEKQARSWAGRWIPTEDGLPLRKMMAVRQVFETFLQPKLLSQSTLQSPFFKLCSQAFRSQGIDHEGTSVEQLVACAELQVEDFLKEDGVRI